MASAFLRRAALGRATPSIVGQAAMEGVGQKKKNVVFYTIGEPCALRAGAGTAMAG